eukprot:g25292.t1
MSEFYSVKSAVISNININKLIKLSCQFGPPAGSDRAPPIRRFIGLRCCRYRLLSGLARAGATGQGASASAHVGQVQVKFSFTLAANRVSHGVGAAPRRHDS